MGCLFSCLSATLSRIGTRVYAWYLINKLDYIKRDSRDPDKNFFVVYFFPLLEWILSPIFSTILFVKNFILSIFDSRRAWSVYGKRKRTPFLFVMFRDKHPLKNVFLKGTYCSVMILWSFIFHMLQVRLLPKVRWVALLTTVTVTFIGTVPPLLFKKGWTVSLLITPRLMLMIVKSLLMAAVFYHLQIHSWERTSSNFNAMRRTVACEFRFMNTFVKESLNIKNIFDQNNDNQGNGDSEDVVEHALTITGRDDGLLGSVKKIRKFVKFSKKIFDKCTELIKKIGKYVADLFTDIVENLRGNAMLSTVFYFLQQMLIGIMDVIATILGSTIELLTGILKQVLENLKTLFNTKFSLDFKYEFKTTTEGETLMDFLTDDFFRLYRSDTFLIVLANIFSFVLNNLFLCNFFIAIYTCVKTIYKYLTAQSFANEYITQEFIDLNEENVKNDARNDIFPLNSIEAMRLTLFNKCKMSIGELEATASTVMRFQFLFLCILWHIFLDYITYFFCKTIIDQTKALLKEFFNVSFDQKKKESLLFQFSFNQNLFKKSVDKFSENIDECTEMPEKFEMGIYQAPFIYMMGYLALGLIDPYLRRWCIYTCYKTFTHRNQKRARWLIRRLKLERFSIKLLQFFGAGFLNIFLDGGGPSYRKPQILCEKCRVNLTHQPAYNSIRCKSCKAISCPVCVRESKKHCLKCGKLIDVHDIFLYTDLDDYYIEKMYAPDIHTDSSVQQT